MSFTEISKPSATTYEEITPSDMLLSTSGVFLLLTSGGKIILRKATNSYTAISKPSAPTYTTINKP